MEFACELCVKTLYLLHNILLLFSWVRLIRIATSHEAPFSPEVGLTVQLQAIPVRWCATASKGCQEWLPEKIQMG